MKKKTLGRMAALSIAALTAVPTFSIVASAEVTVTSAWRIPVAKDAYGVYTYEYYNSQAEASFANGRYSENGSPVAPVSVTSIPNISVGSNIYIDGDGKILPGTAPAGSGYVAGKWGGSNSGTSTGTGTSTGSGGYTFDNVPSSYRYATNKRYKSRSSGKWYPNLSMLGAIEGAGIIYEEENLPANSPSWSSTNTYFDYTQGVYTNVSTGTVAVNSSNYSTGYSSNYYNDTYRYYSSRTGLFYTSESDAIAASGGYSSYVTNYYLNSSTTRTSTYTYYSRYTGRYYATREAAIIASGDNSSYVDGTGSYTVYFSTYTGRYYDTLSAANSATPSGYSVRTITNSLYSASYLNTYSSYGYLDGYYNGYYGYYNDPNYYYYYYLMGNNGTTTTTKDTSTVTIGNYKGWTNVARVINAAKSGSSYAVDMQTETEIPETVLKALKGKNIDMSFVFSGGAILTINGNDITSTTAISPVIKYQSTSIPSTLKKKAVKANSGVSSSQFTINGGSFGASASVTIKFNTKRAGCSAKLYRYNSSANTLSLVSRSAVQSNGQCRFDDVKQGGEYIVVLS